jgi:hypothetical protein
MRKKILHYGLLSLLLILLSLSELFARQGGIGSNSSKTTKTTAKNKSREVEVPVNIGVGPTAHIFYGLLQEEQLAFSGFELDLYAVITPELIKANRHRIPKKYKSKADGIKGEVHLTPGWLMLLPEYLFISPPVFGTSAQAYGAGWTFFGITQPLIQGDWGHINVHAKLPTISVFWVDADILQQSRLILGLGVSPGAEFKYRFSETFHLQLKYAHNLYIPFEGGTSLVAKSGNSEFLIQHGSLSLLLNFRFPYTHQL